MLHFCYRSFLLSIGMLALLVYIALFVNDTFVRPFLGDVLVVIWLFFTLRTLLHLSTYTLAASVLCIAYLIEFAQYFQVLNHLGLAHIDVLRIVFGATYDSGDLLAYTLGYALIIAGHKLCAKRNTP